MCFVFVWEQTATCATYSINWLVFITEMKSVYCEVWTSSLNKTVCASSLKGQRGGFCNGVGMCLLWGANWTHLCHLYSFLSEDPRSIPSLDLWDILCTKWHWTAVILFSPVSVILPVPDVSRRPYTAATWRTNCRSLQAVKQSNDSANFGEARIAILLSTLQNVGVLVS